MSDSQTTLPLAKGVYVALLTPRRPACNEADAAVLLDYLDTIAAAGVNGLVLFGSTGEFVHFDLAERMRVAALAIKRSRLPVLVNASHSTLSCAVELAENAIEAGASGILLAPPHFYVYGEEQLFAYYQAFIESLGRTVPVYLYNIPMFVSPIPPALAARLLTSGTFAGIKDSSGDPNYLQHLLDLHKQTSFQLLLGNEALYVNGTQAGADGVVSGVAAALPELIVALNRAVLASDVPRSEALHRRLLEFLDFLHRFPATVIIRQAAVARGWQLTHSAVPFDEDMAAEIIAFHAWFRDWWPQTLAECK